MFHFNINDVTNFFGITRAAFDKWKQDPTFPKEAIVGRGIYDLRVLHQWHLWRFFGSGELAAEKLKGQRLKNDKAELELDVEKGKYIPKSEVLEEFVKRIHVLKSDLLSIEKRLPAGSKERETVKKAVRRILENYSRPTGVLNETTKNKEASQ